MAKAPAQKTDTGMLPEYDFHLPNVVEDAVSFVGKEIALNSFSRYLIALAIAVLGVLFIWAVKGFISRKAEKGLSSLDKTRMDHQMAEEVGTTLVPLLYLFRHRYPAVLFRRSQRAQFSSSGSLHHPHGQISFRVGKLCH